MAALQKGLYQFFGLKKALEVSHLPDASQDEDEGLNNGPPQHPLVCALTGHAESLFSILQNKQSRKSQEQTGAPPLAS